MTDFTIINLFIIKSLMAFCNGSVTRISHMELGKEDIKLYTKVLNEDILFQQLHICITYAEN